MVRSGGVNAKQNRVIASSATRSSNAIRSAVLAIRSGLVALAASASRFHRVQVDRRVVASSTVAFA